MKRISFISLVLLLSVAFPYLSKAQSETDAYKMAQSQLIGSARSVAMGGAFGALGADPSAYSINPAGLALYRTYDLSMTIGNSIRDNKALWMGHTENKTTNKFSFDNFAFTGVIPTASNNGIFNFNIGVNYRKLMNFDRDFTMAAKESGELESISKYIANITNGIAPNQLTVDKNFNAYYDSNNAWLPILGYGAYLTDNIPGTTRYTSSFGNALPSGSALTMRETGDVSAYDFGFAMNISDYVYLGTTISLLSMDYSLNAEYGERFSNSADDELSLSNSLKTQGGGVGATFGVIVRPTDALRLGISFQTPMVFALKDYPYSTASIRYLDKENKIFKGEGNTPMDAYFEYRYNRPAKLTLSGAAIIGHMALVSVDYEFTNYGKAKFNDSQADQGLDSFRGINTAISDVYRNSGMLRLGVEIKPTRWLALRTGYAHQSDPLRDKNKEKEISTSGTLPHYTMPDGINHITFGVGFRTGSNWYIDVATVFSSWKETVFVYPSQLAQDGARTKSAELTSNQVRLAFTLGYKF